MSKTKTSTSTSEEASSLLDSLSTAAEIEKILDFMVTIAHANHPPDFPDEGYSPMAFARTDRGKQAIHKHRHACRIKVLNGQAEITGHVAPEIKYLCVKRGDADQGAKMYQTIVQWADRGMDLVYPHNSEWNLLADELALDIWQNEMALLIQSDLRTLITNGRSQQTQPARIEKNQKPTKRREQKRQPTEKQLEALQIVGECRGNFAEAARRMKCDRKTVKQHYQAGLKNAGRLASRFVKKPSIRATMRDRRGQEDITESDDIRRG